MILRKCEEYTWKYEGQSLCGFFYIPSNTNIPEMQVHNLRLKMGDKIVFVKDDSIYEGSITNIEKPFNNELYEEIDMFEVDGEEFSIGEVDWIGVL